MPRTPKIQAVGTSRKFRILRGKRRAVLYGPEWRGKPKRRNDEAATTEWSPRNNEAAIRIDHTELERVIKELKDVLDRDVVKV